MLKAFRYLKPFWLSVVAVVALVFGQVQLELALPDYMSNIVTYGIQYNGITENITSRQSLCHLHTGIYPEQRGSRKPAGNPCKAIPDHNDDFIG